MDVETQKIREYDADRNLKVAGFAWPMFKLETVRRIHAMRLILGIGGSIIGFFMGIPLMFFVGPIGSYVLIAGVFACIVAWMLKDVSLKTLTKMRAVTFSADGGMMHSDDGEPFRPTSLLREGISGKSRTPVRVESISSIEVANTIYNSHEPFAGPYRIGKHTSSLLFRVNVHLRDGQTMTLYEGLATKDDATIIATNLNAALLEIRRAMPREMRGG